MSSFPECGGWQGAGTALLLQARGWGSSAQCLDVNMASGSNPDQGHRHGLWWYLGPSIRHRSQLQQGHGLKHDPQHQPDPGCQHGLRRLCRFLISTCSSLPLSLRVHLSPQCINPWLHFFLSHLPTEYSIFPISPSHTCSA